MLFASTSMARGIQEDSSTDMFTASSSEDEGCSQRRPRRSKKVVTNINIKGRDHNIAVGKGASVTSKTTEAPARTVNDITANDFDAAEHLKNPAGLLDAVAKYRGTEKDNIEKYILQDFFPYVEKHAINAASSYNDALELLARFSSPDLNSPRLAIHSLKIMKRLLDAEFGHCESANAHIITVERILREPFVDGSFAKELQHNQRRRAEVYNNVLALVLLYIAKGHLKHPYIKKNDKEELKETVSKNINKTLQRNPRPQKDRWRYSMETVLNLIERLFDYKRLSQMTKLLDLCKDIRQLEAFFKKLHGIDSVDQFVILKMFHGKLCTNDDGAYQVVQDIIMNHHVFSKQWQHTKEDWQFALLACQTLLHTITSDKLSKATRIRAAHCLASLTKAKVYGKSNVIRYIIEKHCIKTLFARDLESRRIVIERFDEGFPDDILRKVFINQICKTHESKGLEYRDETLYEDEDRLIKRGLYDHRPAAIAVALIGPMNKLYSVEHQDLSTAEKHLQNETRILQHLNQTANEHVPMVFAADTKTRPFHMICEYLPKQDLLQFLTVNCIEAQQPPTYRQLLQICLGISKCMIFIHSKRVIHKQLLPQHVLLDHDDKVKITGFWNARILSADEMKEGVLGEKLSCDDPSIRFAAPECLGDEPLFSLESDIWSFGVLMYVVFTCGGTPYANQDTKDIQQHVLSGRSLTKDWLRDDIFSLIQKCMGENRKDRISFQKVSEELQKLLDGKGADEWVTIPETVPKKDDESNGDDPIPTEEENALGISQLMVNSNSALSNPKGGFRPPLKNKKKRSSSVSRGQRYLVDYSKGHLTKLKSLRHVHLARIVNDRKTRIGREITFESCEGPNLRNYILGNDCAPSDVIRFATQITEAIQFLHSNNIVICVLNAECIRVVNSSQVKLFGLHFSRSILPSHNDLTISLGVVHGDVDPSMYRWCAKEVIQDGLFSPAGDIWSLGMTILEMFMCLSKDDSAKPFPLYSDEKILNVLKMNGRPSQPARCPDWVYIVVTQCWCLHPIERASLTAVLDCLTHRHPKESYLLQRWIEKNEIHENWPDLNVIQELDNANSISRQAVEESVSDEFADQHTYEYERPFWLRKAFKNVMSKVTSFLPSTSTPQPVLASRPSNGISESVLPSPGQPALPSVAGPTSSSLATKNSSIHSRSLTLDTYNSGNANLGQSEEGERVEYATVGSLDIKNATGRIDCMAEGKSEVVHGNEAEQGPSRRARSLSTTSLPLPPVPETRPAFPSNDDDDTYDRPKPDNISVQEIYMSLDVEQRKEKQEGDGNYDDVCNRPKSGDNPYQNCNTSDIKQMKVNLQEDGTYDDVNHRPRAGETWELPNYEYRTPDPEPQVNLVGESYQELAYCTEEGYMPLISWNSNGLVDESIPFTQMNQTYSGTPVSAVPDDAKKAMCCEPVFYMNL